MNIFACAVQGISDWPKENPVNLVTLLLGLDGPFFTSANYTEIANQGYVVTANGLAAQNSISDVAIHNQKGRGP